MKNNKFRNLLAFLTFLIFANSVSASDPTKARERAIVLNKVVFEKSEIENPPLRMVEFGIRYMPTFSGLDLNAYNGDVVKGKVTLRQGFGVLLGLNLNNHIGVQGEINYYKVSQNFRDLNLDNEINIKYINIPVLLSINTNKAMRVNLNVVAGPQFGINVGSNIKTTGTGDGENIRAVAAVKKGDIGLAYGAGLEFALNENHTARLDLGYRGFYGMVNMNASNSGSDTYNVIVKASRKTNAVYIGLTLLF
jgi:opacity protein-like surface antigen